jgi:hypothetical protein
MVRFRSLVPGTPALVISALAVVLSLGGGAYASTQATGHAAGHATSHRGNAPAVSQVVKAGPTASSSKVAFKSLNLLNGWVSEQHVYQTGDPKVGLLNGIVYLKGSLAQPTPSSDEFAVLPAKYRPSNNLYITVYTNGGTQGSLYIGHNGVMEAFSGVSCGSGTTSECYTSLATVSYPINS